MKSIVAVVILLIFFAHHNQAKAVDAKIEGNSQYALSSSGKFIATLSESGVIVIWNTESRKRIVECWPLILPLHTKKRICYNFSDATGLCFHSCRDDILFFCNHEAIYSWEWEKNHPRVIFKFSSKSISPPLRLGSVVANMSSSKDGKRLAIIDLCGNIGVCTLLDNAKLEVFPSGRKLPDDWWNFIAFISSSDLVYNDGCWLKKIRLSSTGMKTQETLFAKSDDRVSMEVMAISSNGKLMASSTSSGEVRLWDLVSKKNHLFCQGHEGSPCLSFSHDGNLLVVGDKVGVLSVYSVKTGTRLCSTEGPETGFSGVGFLPDNTTVFGIGEYSNVRYWRLDNNTKLKIIE